MNNIHKHKTIEDDNSFLISQIGLVKDNILPDEKILRSALGQIKKEDIVTNLKQSRFNSWVWSKDKPTISFFGQMNRFSKILSGTVVATLLVFMVVFGSKGGDGKNNQNSVFYTEITETINVANELAGIEKDEPIIDDSDLFINLLNSNEYEI
jgi:hypothetical protein